MDNSKMGCDLHKFNTSQERVSFKVWVKKSTTTTTAAEMTIKLGKGLLLQIEHRLGIPQAEIRMVSGSRTIIVPNETWQDMMLGRFNSVVNYFRPHRPTFTCRHIHGYIVTKLTHDRVYFVSKNDPKGTFYMGEEQLKAMLDLRVAAGFMERRGFIYSPDDMRRV